MRWKQLGMNDSRTEVLVLDKGDEVVSTLEVMVTQTPSALRRTIDEATGLALLDPG